MEPEVPRARVNMQYTALCVYDNNPLRSTYFIERKIHRKSESKLIIMILISLLILLLIPVLLFTWKITIDSVDICRHHNNYRL